METVKKRLTDRPASRCSDGSAADALPPVTKTQQKLVRILQEVDALSEKEACYLSGVTWLWQKSWCRMAWWKAIR
ncbi:MAG: hypothetical protein ACLUOF_04010 [Ruminococcus sp.]